MCFGSVSEAKQNEFLNVSKEKILTSHKMKGEDGNPDLTTVSEYFATYYYTWAK